eukprot:TRINITY_DN8625_c0_g1_i1.p1 TRINITY_DN8625_c0_g1~~TRINITY_DN8625_c0_g1_i1.p1  ORF type:complete len:298 (+),score=79.55 TRINITY_DN8625_c0_g1_i1:129-1022(+)
MATVVLRNTVHSFSWADEVDAEEQRLTVTSCRTTIAPAMVASSTPTRIARIPRQTITATSSPSSTITLPTCAVAPTTTTTTTTTATPTVPKITATTASPQKRIPVTEAVKQEAVIEEGCYLFVGGVVFTDLEKLLVDPSTSRPPHLAHRKRRGSETDAEKAVLLAEQHAADAELLKHYTKRRVQCLSDMLAEFGPIVKLTPRWQRRHCHVTFADAESAKRAYEAIADPVVRKGLFERAKDKLRGEGEPVDLVPTRFYLRWAEKDEAQKRKQKAANRRAKAQQPQPQPQQHHQQLPVC